MGRKDAETYYDEFAAWYERARGRGYHAFLDRMELAAASPWVKDREVLEAGCGTGLILEGLARLARRAVGVDISSAMLEQARARGLEVVKGSVTDLPFADGAFDAVVSFKVLAHVPDLRRALAECARVTRPGGHLVLEFYNRRSIRYLVKKLKPAHRVAEGTFDTEVHTVYHTWEEVLALLPENVQAVDRAGIRILAPTHHFYHLPGLGRVTESLEAFASGSPLRRWGGFLVGVFRVA
ncbi:MAG: class I SAM-dependent methyltransferase [Deltaproteobacteria bacterium]|nr:class I SAM-dependent methyltransferase [Deltaproteobacteria bacterium]